MCIYIDLVSLSPLFPNDLYRVKTALKDSQKISIYSYGLRKKTPPGFRIKKIKA